MDRETIACRLGAALKAILEGQGLKPAVLARADLGLAQTTVYRIIGGEQLPDLHQLRQIEAFLGLARGEVERRAGVSEPPGWTFAECLALDEGLDEAAIEDLLFRYRMALQATADRRAHDASAAAEALREAL
jgi:hypothetical protein